MPLFTIPVELAVSKKSLVRVALALVTLVDLFMRGIKKF